MERVMKRRCISLNDNQNLSDTLEINVDKARKAVGSLFDDNNGEVNNKKNIDKPDMKRITNLFAKGSAEPSPKPADDKSDLEYPEDDWLTMGSPLRRKSSVPMPKPAIKVNESTEGRKANASPSRIVRGAA